MDNVLSVDRRFYPLYPGPWSVHKSETKLVSIVKYISIFLVLDLLFKILDFKIRTGQNF